MKDIKSTYKKNGSTNVSPEPTSKKSGKRAPRRNIPGRLFLIVLFIFGLYVGFGYLVSIEPLRVETISLSGNNVIVAADITPVVKGYLKGYRFWPYRNDSIFVLQKKDIKEALFLKFKRIEGISIKKVGLKEVEVVVEEKEGQYLWCGEINSLGSEDTCYIIDANGSLFDVAPQVSGDAYFKIFGGQVDGESPIGSEVFSLEDFNKIIEIKDELDLHKLSPIALLLYDDGLIEFIKKTEDKNLYEGARIKFTLLVDYKEAIDNLLSALNSEPLKSEFAEKEGLLQYIDVRFDNRVYYKFK
ncbi:hypothetical protein GW765_00585 [Candidatus Parcubacteria bacterium]|nr:hypothetical protein [Candidatus Parcubacteria bacterium]